MMIRLIVIILLVLSSTARAGGWIQFEKDILDNSQVGSGALFRQSNKVAMTSSGDVYAFVTFGRDPDTLRAVWFPAWGDTYEMDTAVWPQAVPYYDVAGVGDTIVFTVERIQTDVDVMLGFVTNNTISIDTAILDASMGDADGRSGAFMVGALPAIMVVEDDATATPDSSFVAIPTGWPQAGDFVIKQNTTTKFDAGWRTPLTFDGEPWGILVHEIGNDLWVCDTLGLTEVTTNFLVANNFESQMMLMVNDSEGVGIQQVTETAGGDSVVTLTFKLRGIGTASVTYVAGTYSVLMTEAETPDGQDSWPVLSHVVGTDSVIAYYVHFPAAGNLDSVNIAYNVSADKGATWGSRQIMAEARDGYPIMHLQMPSKIYKDGDGGLYNYAFLTLQEAVDDSMWIYKDTLVAPGQAPTRGRYHIIE